VGSTAPVMTKTSQHTKDRILSAALKEFSAKGYAGARVNVIARRAPRET
jgi:AcrR family transcriptional regulator